MFNLSVLQFPHLLHGDKCRVIMKIKWEVNTCNYLEYYLKNAKFSKDTRGHNDDDNDGDGK